MREALLTVVGLWCFVVAFAGAVLGLVLGNIRLPILLLAGSSPAAVGGANIAVSGISAAAGSIAHVRARRVDLRLAAWMIPPSVAGALGGGYAAGHLPATVLQVVIGSALLVFGIDLLRPKRTPVPEPREEPNLRAAILAGAGIGALGGLIGLILGTLRLPALLQWVGEEPARAVGTNLLVGITVGAAGLVGHLPGGVDWTLLVVGGAASLPGALLGSRYAGRLSAAALLRAIGVILLVSGTITIVRGLVE